MKDERNTATDTVSGEDLVAWGAFEKLKSRLRNRTIRRRIFYGVIAVTLCLLFAVICAVVFFRVGSIDVRGNTEYSDEVISEASGIAIGDNIFTISRRDVRNNLILNYPYIRGVKLTRQIPSTVVLDVTEEEPIYYISIGGENFVVSQTLKVLEKAEAEEDLVKANGPLIKMTLPEVRYAVVGRTVLFKTETAYPYIKAFVDEIGQSQIAPYITVLNCQNRFGVYIVYEGPHGSFRINLGSASEIENKLAFAWEMLKSFGQKDRGTVDVQANPGFVILDPVADLG